MRAEVRLGEITAGETQLILRPNTVPSVPRYGLLITHGAGSSADGLLAYGNANRRSRLVADAGITGVSADFGGPQTWGNAAAMTAMTNAYNWLQLQPGVKPGKVLLCGGSMGGLNALVWAAANPTKVAAISIYIPVLNLREIHTNNLGPGFTSLINTAHGGTFPTTLNATKDPMTIALNGGYAGIPILIHYGTTDAICLPANNPTFKTRVGALCTVNAITGGHAESTELAIDRIVERDFLLQYSR